MTKRKLRRMPIEVPRYPLAVAARLVDPYWGPDDEHRAAKSHTEIARSLGITRQRYYRIKGRGWKVTGAEADAIALHLGCMAWQLWPEFWVPSERECREADRRAAATARARRPRVSA